LEEIMGGPKRVMAFINRTPIPATQIGTSLGEKIKQVFNPTLRGGEDKPKEKEIIQPMTPSVTTVTPTTSATPVVVPKKAPVLSLGNIDSSKFPMLTVDSFLAITTHRTSWNITPEAAKWLMGTYNKNNRPIKTGTWTRYSQDMREGKWIYNGEPIVFSFENGELIMRSGQHRFLACIDAKVPFASDITIGIKAEAVATLDTGSTRSPADMLVIDQVFTGPNEKQRSSVGNATVGLLLAYYQGNPANASRARLRNHEIRENFNEFPGLKEATDFIIKKRYDRTVGVPLSVVVALYWLGAYKANRQEDTINFFERIAHLEFKDDKDPAKSLYRRIETTKTSAGRRERGRDIFAVCAKALSAELNGKKVGFAQMVYRNGEPLPQF
jgi:hypothetical protein